jgi:hypothetical protein
MGRLAAASSRSADRCRRGTRGGQHVADITGPDLDAGGVVQPLTQRVHRVRPVTPMRPWNALVRRYLVSRKDRQADPVIANCHVTNRFTAATLRRSEATSVHNRLLSLLSKESNTLYLLTSVGMDRHFSRSCSGNPVWSGWLRHRPALLLQARPTSRIPFVGFLRLCHGQDIEPDKTT